jgi:hypothetical protein
VLRFLTDTAIPPTSNQAVIRSPLRVHAAGVSRPWFARGRKCLTGRGSAGEASVSVRGGCQVGWRMREAG